MKMNQFSIGNKEANIYNGNINYECTNCKRIYKSEKTLLRHKCPHCITCSKSFSSFQKFKSHKCNSTTYSCNDCQKKFKDIQHQNQHKCTFCSKCMKIYATYNNFEKHKCNASISKTIHQPSKILTLIKSVGSVGVYIGDEAIVEALRILRNHMNNAYIGYMTPLEMQYAIDNRDPPPPPPIIQSINIHHIRKNNHWLTSVYEPAASQIYIYDSLTMPSTMQELTQQLELLYGNGRNVHFVPVTQQGTDPACGAFAVAFAFSYALGVPPQTQQYMIPYMREHLRHCIKNSLVDLFPAYTDSRSDYF
ncbi:uncharacterized protein LOC127705244 [Mytilus californianus]|uniref:uncharacterized protein LOC127705244 n=1 Tax=Mytilus californianus TaxID=6549 RepID=UPI0022483C0D|nr:uncharacterized protein LOC127705244 [Mytilus californianus]